MYALWGKLRRIAQGRYSGAVCRDQRKCLPNTFAADVGKSGRIQTRERGITHIQPSLPSISKLIILNCGLRGGV